MPEITMKGNKTMNIKSRKLPKLKNSCGGRRKKPNSSKRLP